jgi:DNA-directed RNA polymerase specialized sigma24 family protein
MTTAKRTSDYNEAINQFLKLYGKELELRAMKLTGCYGIDFHELLSRTAVTVWEKWPDALCALPDDERYKFTVCTLLNHARNLSRNARRDEAKFILISGEELDSLTRAIAPYQDSVAIEAIFEDERFEIYGAISLLGDKCRDVMTLIALGLEDVEIRQELGMTATNLSTIKARARKLLRKTLGLGDDDGKGGSGGQQ